MADDLYRRLGLDPDNFSSEEAECNASEECHAICNYLLDQCEYAQEQYTKAMDKGDEIAAYRIRVAASALLEAAHAIHMGAHLED